MSCISEIFDRAHIQHIREFLLHGVECVKISDKSYQQRIDESCNSIISLIRTQSSDVAACERITTAVYSYANEVENVYMEIGLQCSAILAAQLLSNSQEE